MDLTVPGGSDPEKHPDIQPPRRPEKRWLAVGCAAGVLAVAAVLQLRSRGEREADSVPEFAKRPPLVMPAAEASPDTPGQSGLYVPAQAAPPPDAPMTLDQFMDTLETEAPPVHQALTAAVKNEPPIRKAWETFRKERGPKAPAAEFMRALRPLAEFRQLLARFRGEPGFQSAFLKVMQHPELGPAMLGRIAAAGAPEVGRKFSGVGSFKPVAAHAGALADPTIASRWAALGASGASGAGGPGGQSASTYQAGEAGRGGAAGPEAHNATPLDKKWEDKKVISKSDDQKKFEELLTIFPCLAPLGVDNVKHLIKSADIFQHGGVWGACFKANMYGTCAQSALQPPCSKPLDTAETPGCWQACLDANGLAASDLTCIKQVRNQPGCSAPKDIPVKIWKHYCTQPTDGDGLFTALQPPHQNECGVFPVNCVNSPSDPGCLCSNRPPAKRSAICGVAAAAATLNCTGGQGPDASGTRCVCPSGKPLNPATNLCEPIACEGRVVNGRCSCPTGKTLNPDGFSCSVNCADTSNCGDPKCAKTLACKCPNGVCPGTSSRACSEIGGKYQWYDDGTCYSDGGICCGAKDGPGPDCVKGDPPQKPYCICTPPLKYPFDGAAPPKGVSLCN